jgi:hypothetical protein
MQCKSEHAGMFAGAVVLQNVWLLAALTQLASDFRAKGLMGATLQVCGAESNLPEHRGCNFSVNRFTAV